MEPALGTYKKTKLNICHHMLTSSKQLQNRSFDDVERTRTSSKCQKLKNARAKRAKILFFIVKYANLSGFCCRRRRGCLSSLIPFQTAQQAESPDLPHRNITLTQFWKARGHAVPRPAVANKCSKSLYPFENMEDRQCVRLVLVYHCCNADVDSGTRAHLVTLEGGANTP